MTANISFVVNTIEKSSLVVSSPFSPLHGTKNWCDLFWSHANSKSKFVFEQIFERIMYENGEC